MVVYNPEKDIIKYYENVTKITIPAESGKSKKIKEIFINDVNIHPTYVTVNIGNVTIGRFPLILRYYNPHANTWIRYITYNTGNRHDRSLIGLLKLVFGNDFDIEADEDEDIAFEFNQTVARCIVVYEEGKAGIDKTKPGRSQSKNLYSGFLITTSKDITASGVYPLDKPDNPKGFPDIAHGYVIPSGRQLRIKHIAFSQNMVGSTYVKTLYLRKSTKDLFNPFKEGVRVDNEVNPFYASVHLADIPRMDYVIESGYKFEAEIEVVHDGTNNLPAGNPYLIILGVWELTGR